MQHLAIMNKQWNLLPKILSGEKKVESRWYMAKFAPWDRIKEGETVYFKDAGCPVTLKAEVEKVLQFEDYSDSQLKGIIAKYAKDIAFVKTDEEVFEWAKGKKHCILIYLKNPVKVEPFNIDKTGFGNACAWICVETIEKIKKDI